MSNSNTTSKEHNERSRLDSMYDMQNNVTGEDQGMNWVTAQGSQTNIFNHQNRYTFNNTLSFSDLDKEFRSLPNEHTDDDINHNIMRYTDEKKNVLRPLSTFGASKGLNPVEIELNKISEECKITERARSNNL